MHYKQKLTETVVRKLVIEQLSELKEKNNVLEAKETLQEGKVLNSVLGALLAMSVNAFNAQAKENPEAAEMAKKMMLLQKQIISNIESEAPKNAQEVINALVANQGKILKDPNLDLALKNAGKNLQAATAKQAQQNAGSRPSASDQPVTTSGRQIGKLPRPTAKVPNT